MVEPIAASFIQQFQNQAPPPPVEELNDAQAEIVNEILANFDSSNLSDSDITEINQSFEAAGITPSASLKETIEVSGFDPVELASGGASGVQPGAPAGPPPASQDFVEALTQILAEYDVDKISEEQITEIKAKLAEEGFTPPAPGEQLVQIDA